MHRFNRWLDRSIMRPFEFFANFWYYLNRGHMPGAALDLAKRTLPL